MMTCKKTIITITTLLFFILNMIVNTQAQAVQGLDDDYLQPFSGYSKMDPKVIKREADRNFFLYFGTKDKLKKERYINSALKGYYILSQVTPSDIDIYIKLGKIYDEKNISELAKTNFYKALNISKDAAMANFYFGDYYYKRNDYKKALYHYKIAYKNGVLKHMTLI